MLWKSACWHRQLTCLPSAPSLLGDALAELPGCSACECCFLLDCFLLDKTNLGMAKLSQHVRLILTSPVQATSCCLLPCPVASVVPYLVFICISGNSLLYYDILGQLPASWAPQTHEQQMLSKHVWCRHQEPSPQEQQEQAVQLEAAHAEVQQLQATNQDLEAAARAAEGLSDRLQAECSRMRSELESLRSQVHHARDNSDLQRQFKEVSMASWHPTANPQDLLALWCDDEQQELLQAVVLLLICQLFFKLRAALVQSQYQDSTKQQECDKPLTCLPHVCR